MEGATWYEPCGECWVGGGVLSNPWPLPPLRCPLPPLRCPLPPPPPLLPVRWPSRNNDGINIARISMNSRQQAAAPREH